MRRSPFGCHLLSLDLYGRINCSYFSASFCTCWCYSSVVFEHMVGFAHSLYPSGCQGVGGKPESGAEQWGAAEKTFRRVGGTHGEWCRFWAASLTGLTKVGLQDLIEKILLDSIQHPSGHLSIPFHPIPSHPIWLHPIPFHLIPSPSTNSFLTVLLSRSLTTLLSWKCCLGWRGLWFGGGKGRQQQHLIHPSIHPSLLVSLDQSRQGQKTQCTKHRGVCHSRICSSRSHPVQTSPVHSRIHPQSIAERQEAGLPIQSGCKSRRQPKYWLQCSQSSEKLQIYRPQKLPGPSPPWLENAIIRELLHSSSEFFLI